jgi:hypothetical protein
MILRGRGRSFFDRPQNGLKSAPRRYHGAIDAGADRG